jgi:HAD superfamily hydrolase (TIGR01459 family)
VVECALSAVPEIGMAVLVKRYDVLLFDAYGVLVHADGAMPGAVALVQWLNRIGKPYYILTNDASKQPQTAASRYREFGLFLPPGSIITSGSLLAGYFRTNGLEGADCVVLGPADSRQYVEQAGGRIVSPSNDFEVLVVADEAGFPFLETVDAVFTSLCRMLDGGHQIHLLLPNPDLIYPKGGRGFGFAAGSIAGMFEAALNTRYSRRDGMTFTRLGKPHFGLYAEALSRSGTRNMVMIGDQLETDIRGARAFGLAAAWIGTGVTAQALASFPAELRPTYHLRSLLI